jgi:ABC-2 type transport system ATP-binding protein
MTVIPMSIHLPRSGAGEELDGAENACTATHAVRRQDSAGLLEVRHLRKSFGDIVAVDDLSFSVSAGEIFGLVGPNGAGKSTTMMIVAGVRRADSGTVTIGGHVAGKGHRTVQMMLGVVPQDLAIYADLTARENLDFFGQIYGVRGAELERRIERVLAQVGLKSHADRCVRTFSGGMKRRLNIGVALIHDPRFVIFDEPTVGIDPQSRSHILDCVRHLAASGVGVIYASHYMEEVEAICQRVAIVDHGKLMAEGTLEELIDPSRTELCVRVAAPEGALKQHLRGLADVIAAGANESQAVIRSESGAAPQAPMRRLARLLEVLAGAGFEVLSIEIRKQNLERLFLELTGRKLRD